MKTGLPCVEALVQPDYIGPSRYAMLERGAGHSTEESVGDILGHVNQYPTNLSRLLPNIFSHGEGPDRSMDVLWACYTRRRHGEIYAYSNGRDRAPFGHLDEPIALTCLFESVSNVSVLILTMILEYHYAAYRKLREGCPASF